MVQRYKLEKKNSEKQQENYTSVLPRIISSPRSREAAESYINNADFQEKMAITRMLNEWNKDTFSFEDTQSVIRPEAVPVIKDWMNTAESNDVTCAKNLLTHISQEKKRTDDITERNSPRPRTNQSNRPKTNQSNRPESKQQKRAQWKPTSSRPSTSYSVNSYAPSTPRNQKPSTSNGRKTTASKRPTMRPKTSITHGSFYPSAFEGFGNNTSHFNIVRSQNRPKTMLSKAQLYRQKYGNQEASYPEPYNPINRSGVFGIVIPPPPQESVNVDGSLSQRLVVNSSRPATQQSQRPATRDQGRKSRPTTQGGMQKRESDEKLRFSANIQDDNNNDNNVPPISTSPVQQDNSNGLEGSESFRSLGLQKHYPGRHYQSTQYLLG